MKRFTEPRYRHANIISSDTLSIFSEGDETSLAPGRGFSHTFPFYLKYQKHDVSSIICTMILFFDL
jgi:hypothetical protein